MDKKKTYMVFAVFAAVLMLMATGIAGPVQEKSQMDAEESLSTDLDILSEKLKKDRTASSLIDRLKKYPEVASLINSYQETDDEIEKTSILSEIASLIEDKAETQQLIRIIQSDYTEEQANIEQSATLVLAENLPVNQGAYLPGQNPAGMPENAILADGMVLGWAKSPDIDTDGDGTNDFYDDDMTNNGIDDDLEVQIGLNPEIDDTDGDGVDDNVELELGSDPTDPNSIPAQEEIEEYTPETYEFETEYGTVTLSGAEYAILEQLAEESDMPIGDVITIIGIIMFVSSLGAYGAALICVAIGLEDLGIILAWVYFGLYIGGIFVIQIGQFLVNNDQ